MSKIDKKQRENIGKRLKALRESYGLTQEQVLNMLNKRDKSVDERTFRRYESGDTDYPLNMLIEFANI